MTAEVFKALMNSKAVAESNPLVALSQHWILAPLKEASAIDTLFFHHRKHHGQNRYQH